MLRLSRREWLGIATVFLLLFVYGSLLSLHTQLFVWRLERISWLPVGYNFLIFLLWLPLVPLVWTVADRVRPRRWGWLRWGMIQLPVTIAFGALHIVLLTLVVAAIRVIVGQPMPLLELLLGWERGVYTASWLTAAGTLGAFYGVDAYRRWREEQLRAERLSAQLKEAKLQALKMQLHPHFLFNTLQTISALIPRDPRRAEELIEKLGALLRTALELGDRPLIALDEELAFIERYLDIQQARLGERLRVRWEVDPDTREEKVPAFVLQPLVENAIKHGIAPRPEPGTVAVGASLEENKLRLWVQDDGPGLNSKPKEGHGLRTLKERLRTLYGPEAKLELLNGAKGGLLARIEIPLSEGRSA